MHAAQQEFTDEILARIGQAVRATADLTRCGLSRLVCERVNWRDAAGRAKESSSRALLVKLERRGVIELPPTRQLAAHWQQRYGEQPVLVQMFVDSSRYRGTCYRAADRIAHAKS